MSRTLAVSVVVTLVGLVLAAPSASAQTAPPVERSMVVSLVAGGGAGGPADLPDYGEPPPADGIGLVRAMVSWEQPLLPYREPRGYVWATQIVPELQLGAIYVGEERDELVGAGLRFELLFSQRRMGLLQVSARGGMYLAGRAALMTDAHHTPMGEGAFGSYFWLGDDVRLGWEIGLAAIFGQEPDYVIYDATARVPWADEGGTYLLFDAAVTLGLRL